MEWSTPDNEAWGRLISMKVAVLATTNADGSAHLVPFTFAAVAPGILVTAVDDKPKRTRRLRRITNIRRDPRASVLVHHYEDDWEKLWWVRAECLATVTEAEPPGAREALGARYPPYAAQTLGPWVTLEVTALASWGPPGRSPT